MSSNVDSLLDACRGSHTEAALTCINEGADLNAKTSSGDTALHISCDNGLTVVALALIEKGADVDAWSRFQDTALHICSEHNLTEVAIALLQKGAMVNARDVDQATPLHHALRSCMPEVAAILIKEGADLNAGDKEKQTPLGMIWKFPTLIKIIIDRGVDVSFRSDDGKAPLHLCLDGRYVESAVILIDNGASVNAEDNNQRAPLHVACGIKCSEAILALIDKLIENGANVNARDNSQRAPLHVACGVECSDPSLALIDKLIENGADVNARDDNLLTPLHVACGMDPCWIGQLLHPSLIRIRDTQSMHEADHKLVTERSEIAHKLIEKGANVNAEDNNQRTPLHVACGLESSDASVALIGKLLENGADKDKVDGNGDSPLSMAIKKNCADVVMALIHRFNVAVTSEALWDSCGHSPQTISLALIEKASDNETLSALHPRTCWNGHYKVAKALLEKGAEVNDEHDLHIACMQRSLSLVRVLVDFSANINGRDRRNSTPLDVACLYGAIDVVYLLIGKGALLSARPTLSCCNRQHAPVLKFISAKGALLHNERERFDLSKLLRQALYHGFDDLAIELVRRGADVNVKNSDGKCALDFCKSPALKTRLLHVMTDVIDGDVSVSGRKRASDYDDDIASNDHTPARAAGNEEDS